MMYEIRSDYIRHGYSRSGLLLKEVKFIVSHDTGNPSSTAYQNRNYFHNQQPKASAHTFIDDTYILEIIPLNEKAWHVLYEKTSDNKMYGVHSNDAAIGVELCWGPGIKFDKAYQRFVWYHAYLCKKYNLDPRMHIVSHKILDTERKIDPDNALNRNGITWIEFLEDVYQKWTKGDETEMLEKKFEPKEHNNLTPRQLNCIKRLASIGVIAVNYKPSEIDLPYLSMMDNLARRLGGYK